MINNYIKWFNSLSKGQKTICILIPLEVIVTAITREFLLGAVVIIISIIWLR